MYEKSMSICFMINQSSLKIKLLTNYHIFEFFVCQQNYHSDCCQTTSIQYKTVHFYFLVGWWIVWQVVLVSVLHCQWARQTESLLKCQTNRSQVKTQHLVSTKRLSGKLSICTSPSGKLSIWKTECLYFCLIVICWTPILGISFLSHFMKSNVDESKIFDHIFNWLYLCPQMYLSSKLWNLQNSQKNWCPWIVMKVQYKIPKLTNVGVITRNHFVAGTMTTRACWHQRWCSYCVSFQPSFSMLPKM